PVTDLDAILVVLDRQQYQQAFVSTLLADAPLLEQPDRDVFDRLIVERVYRDDGELRAGSPLNIAGIGFDLRRGLSVDHVSEIVHVTRGLELGGVEREGENAEEDRQRRHPADTPHRR